ncbi:MAG: alpha/beta fold hydrolase [Gammaproteobacteria bacterium]|nr:MAG: alpha/beta fold hydrolase [Gammaproteobacteria bacterium]
MSTQTKLAVILHCDVVGSTALVLKDERVAHEHIQNAFKNLSDSISRYNGKTQEIRGDALVAVFDRASDAVGAALAFQASNCEVNQTAPDEIKPEMRIGIALGEVVIADSTITGAGVVLSQRLEQLANPNSVVIQGVIREAIPHRLGLHYEALGEQSVKGFDEPVRAYSVELTENSDISPHKPQDNRQTNIGLADQGPVRYCRSTDGVSIAHAKVGEGYPVIVGGSYMTHLEGDWNNPGWGTYIGNLAKHFEVIRYDQRGNGMSDWDDVKISFERMVDDLSAVARCYDYDKFAIFGASQAAAVSIAYAQRNPEKVSHLVLYGGFTRGRRVIGGPEAKAESEAMATLYRQWWGKDNPAIQQTMASLFMPDATPEQVESFIAFQKTGAIGENIARILEMHDSYDVAHLLDDVHIPTLVIHCVGDSVAPLSEGKLIASRIPGAEFVTLDSREHLVLPTDREFARFVDSTVSFIQRHQM